ncbi:hypothetical protein S245_039167, partial [Arachis hypogaea]
HCPQISNPPALFFRELAPSPTLCIFSPSASSSCRRLVGVVHQSRSVSAVFEVACLSKILPKVPMWMIFLIKRDSQLLIHLLKIHQDLSRMYQSE